MERARERERFIRDRLAEYVEPGAAWGMKAKASAPCPFDVAYRRWEREPTDENRRLMLAADAARMAAVRVRLRLPTTPKDVRVTPPKANGRFNVHFFDR